MSKQPQSAILITNLTASHYTHRWPVNQFSWFISLLWTNCSDCMYIRHLGVRYHIHS